MPVSPLWLLSFWFWLASLSSGALWSYGAAFVVLVGVIGETVTEFTEWIKPESRKERVKKISAIVLILGLTGDLLAIRETQLEVATLTKEAGDAKKSAEGAASAANRAKASADEAKQKTDAVSKQADALTLRMEGASRKLGELEQFILVQGPRWRLLKNNKSVFIEALKPFAGQRVTVVRCGLMAPPEPYNLEQNLLIFLGKEGAGWKEESPGYTTWKSCTNGASAVGGNLVICSATASESVKDAAMALFNVLNKLEISTVTTQATPEGRQLELQFLGADSPWELAAKDPTAVILLVGPNPMFDLAGWKKRQQHHKLRNNCLWTRNGTTTETG